MKLFNLFLISFFMGATPFVVSLEQRIEPVNSVILQEERVSINDRQTPKYLDAESTSDAAIVSMD